MGEHRGAAFEGEHQRVHVCRWIIFHRPTRDQTGADDSISTTLGGFSEAWEVGLIRIVDWGLGVLTNIHFFLGGVGPSVLLPRNRPTCVSNYEPGALHVRHLLHPLHQWQHRRFHLRHGTVQHHVDKMHTECVQREVIPGDPRIRDPPELRVEVRVRVFPRRYVGRRIDGVDLETADDHVLDAGEGAESHGGDDAECPTTASAEGPEEVWVAALVGFDDFAGGEKDNGEFEDVVGCHAEHGADGGVAAALEIATENADSLDVLGVCGL